MTTLKRRVYDENLRDDPNAVRKTEAGLNLIRSAGVDYVDLRFTASSAAKARKVYEDIHAVLQRHTLRYKEEKR